MWRAALLLALLLAAAGAAAEEARVLADLEAPETRRLFAQLLMKASAGMTELERAAFVVKGPDGRLDLVLWPFTGQVRRGRFNGRIPGGTVAVVHTHPFNTPRPSYQDEKECVRTGLIFYVLSREAIWRIEPADGRTTSLNLSTSWWKDAVRPVPEEPRRASLAGPGSAPSGPAARASSEALP